MSNVCEGSCGSGKKIGGGRSIIMTGWNMFKLQAFVNNKHTGYL